jgi:hypothetical protein
MESTLGGPKEDSRGPQAQAESNDDEEMLPANIRNRTWLCPYGEWTTPSRFFARHTITVVAVFFNLSNFDTCVLPSRIFVRSNRLNFTDSRLCCAGWCLSILEGVTETTCTGYVMTFLF